MMRKVFVVVGSSSGIGKEIIRNLSSNPSYEVYALSRNISAISNELSAHENIHFWPFDLTKNVKEQLEKSPLNGLTIDYLINNAGVLIKKSFENLQEDDFLTSFRTNSLGVMQTVQALLKQFNKNGTHIVNISTMGAFQGSAKFPELIAYGTTKAAICNFTELFAAEFSESSLKMNCLCLGAVNTPMLQTAFPGYEAQISAEKMAEYIINFTVHSGQFINGKIIPVSISTP